MKKMGKSTLKAEAKHLMPQACRIESKKLSVCCRTPPPYAACMLFQKNTNVLLYFLCGFREKTHFFKPNPNLKYAYKYTTSHSLIFIWNLVVKKEGKCLEHQEESLSSTFVLKVCFISFVLSLLLPSEVNTF
jgi:hypothetical protein